MATGPAGSASREFGERYREVLARSGVDLRLVPTQGGVENLARLNDAADEVSIALVEGGLTRREDSPRLVSLGSLFFEPLWIFSRGGAEGTPPGLIGQRLSIEPEGSATRVLARRLLALNGLDTTDVRLVGLPPEASAEALIEGRIDVAILLSSWRSPSVQRLLLAEGIRLQEHPRADAYVALFPGFNKVVLPAGVAHLGRNLPPADVPMLAVESHLLVRRDLHPAIQYLLLEAASEIHGGAEVFHRPGRFPAPEVVDLPVSDLARQFYKSGRPFVYRHLPFWLSSLAERLLILLIPILAVLLPLTNILPAIYAFTVRRRIFRLYGDLKALEVRLAMAAPGDDLEGLRRAVEELSKRAIRLRVPLGFSQQLFILKSHIAMVQRDVESRGAPAP
jgi:TRAP-type uncharacterized transport system substrate-binding protein